MAYDSEDSTGSSDFEGVSENVVVEDQIVGPGTPSASSSDGTDSSDDEIKDPLILSARAYQLEMLYASLKENIICAMDTGSGKTQV